MYNFTINKILIVFTSFLLMTISLSAQNMQQRKFDPSQMQPVGKISGTIIDSQTSQPIEYGNIVLYRMRDSVVAGGTVTNAQGKYEIDKVFFGRYFLKVSYIGYTTIKIDTLTITPRNTEIKLGVIKLQPKNVSMNEVVVSGQRETMNYNLDKKVFTVDKNFANSGGTAIDIIQNMPSVTVDADGGVAVRGNSNITILIDGRPSALAGFGNADALQQIPASSIESVELITNPSAKYEAEGTGGILNIILKKQSKLGINGTALVNAGTGRKYNTSLNLNLRSENFNLFGSYDGRFFNFYSNGNTLRNTTFEGTTNSLDQTSDNINSINNHNFNLGGDYFLADKEILTLSAQFRIGNFNNGSTIDNKNYLPNNALQSYFQRLSNGNRNLNSGNYTLSYKKTFADKSRELTADVMYLTSSMNNDTKITQQYFNTGFGTVITNPSLQRSLSNNTNRTWLVQSNYIQPLGSWGRLEGGFRSTIKDLRMSNNYLNFNYDALSWVNNYLTNNDYNYKEQVHALYGIYSNNFGGFAFQTGLRAEQALINGKVESTNQTFENNYFSVYPTLHLRYSISDLDEVQFSYSRRVDRPQNRQLNPYEDRSDSLNIFKGNPNLKPQFINSLELGYTKTFGKTSLVSSVFYRQNNNLISTISTLQPNGVTFSTYQNVSKGTSYGAELIANHPLTDWWKVNGNVSYFTNRVDDNGTLGGSRESNSWTARLNSNMTLMEGFQFQLIAYYSSPTILLSIDGGGGGRGGGGMFFGGSTAQSKIKEQYSMDILMRKDFMEGRLTFTLRVTDIFKTRNFNTVTTGEGFFLNSARKLDSRVAYIGISYRLDNRRNPEQERQKRIEEGMDEL